MRQRQAKALCGSFSLASADSTTIWSDPSVVGRPKCGKSEEFPSYAERLEHAAPCWNWKTLFSTRHSAPRHTEDATLHLGQCSTRTDLSVQVQIFGLLYGFFLKRDHFYRFYSLILLFANYVSEMRYVVSCVMTSIKKLWYRYCCYKVSILSIVW